MCETMYRVYYIWKSNADYVPDLLDQSRKRDKSLNYEMVSHVESDIMYRLMQREEIVICLDRNLE